MSIGNEFNKEKAKFYADPKFAAIVGLVVGFILGALFF